MFTTLMRSFYQHFKKTCYISFFAKISEQFEALGASIKVQCAVVVGGVDMVSQSIMLAKKPHIVVATPGRLVDHLENTKGFSLKALKYLGEV